ncbi:hypothetical protein QTG54_000125 [Skeletonema marinoi]|uniref:Uncharacterized protein n=2 Tax=Skeletonema marinoi TaxID=267567 RepID=A0AAD8YN57_9STRA|nr:hypothetical protein QTG54_000125 [Skeletonema marinoi]
MRRRALPLPYTESSLSPTSQLVSHAAMTFFKSKLLGRRAACTDSKSPVACNDTNTNAEEPNAMEQFLNNASGAVSSAVASVFQEAVSMADDMHTIIIADIDEESVKEAHDEEQKPVQPVAAMLIRTIEVKGSPATATLTEPMQETMSCETREDESNACQPTSSRSRVEVKGNSSPATLTQLMTTPDLNEEQPTTTNTKKEVKRNSATLAKLRSKLHKKEKQPTTTNKEAEGSPATLAKLMTKLDKKEKQIVKLEQQINKTEHEVVETKKSIRALAAKFRGVLEGDDDNKVHDNQTRDDRTDCDQSQSECGLSDDDLGLSYDELTDDESEWDDEERDDAIDVALRYTRSQLSTVNKAASKAIFPLGV